MKNKHYFLMLCVIALSTIFSVFAFSGVDAGISKIILCRNFKNNIKLSDR